VQGGTFKPVRAYDLVTLGSVPKATREDTIRQLSLEANSLNNRSKVFRKQKPKGWHLNVNLAEQSRNQAALTQKAFRSLTKVSST